jgi:uncharacterized protein YbjT (DUF2867 family)
VAAAILAGDVVRGPYPTFAEAPLHDHDLAAVAAHALCTDDLLGQRLEVTGPQSLIHQEMVATIGVVVQRPLRYEQVPVEAAIAGMTGQGLPEELVRALVGWYERGSRRPAVTTDTVPRLLGRPAKTFATWVAEHAAEFRR